VYKYIISPPYAEQCSRIEPLEMLLFGIIRALWDGIV
jgi:hypothetical protein